MDSDDVTCHFVIAFLPCFLRNSAAAHIIHIQTIIHYTSLQLLYTEIITVSLPHHFQRFLLLGVPGSGETPRVDCFNAVSPSLSRSVPFRHFFAATLATENPIRVR